MACAVRRDDGTGVPSPAQCLGGLVTIQHRHLHVHQNHVERLLGIEVALAPARKGVQRLLHGLMAVFADMDFGPHLAQDEGNDPLVVWPILGQKDPASQPRLESRGRLGLGGDLCQGLNRLIGQGNTLQNVPILRSAALG